MGAWASGWLADTSAHGVHNCATGPPHLTGTHRSVASLRREVRGSVGIFGFLFQAMPHPAWRAGLGLGKQDREASGAQVQCGSAKISVDWWGRPPMWSGAGPAVGYHSHGACHGSQGETEIDRPPEPTA